MIEKQVEITQNDIFRFQVTGYVKRCGLFFLITTILFGLVLFITQLSQGLPDSLLFWISNFLIIINPLLFLAFYMNARKLKKETVSYNHPITIRISDDSFETEGYNSKHMFPWTDIYDSMEDKNAFYLYISSLQAFIIPKRYFEEKDKQEAIRIFSEHIVSKKKKNFMKVLYIVLSVLFSLFIILEVYKWIF